MFRSIFLKTLRDYRVAILGWGIGMGLVMVSPMASVATLINTPQARAALATLATQFAWNADPIAADTVGGYATFKIGIFIFLIVVWPLLAGSRMLRGEEDRGSLDVLLSVPRTRARVAVEKLAAMWIALLFIGAITGVIAYGGGVAFKADFNLVDGLLFGLDLALICAVFGGVALLISQFTHERGPAAGATGGLLVLFIVLDMVHRVIPNTEWISRLSPIYYYNLSKPLIPSHGASAGGMVVLLVLAAVLSAAAVGLFVRRDAGDVVRLPFVRALAAAPTRTVPTGDWSLRSVYMRSLRMIAAPTFWWTLVIAGFAAWMVVVVEQMVGRLNDLFASASSSPALEILLSTPQSRTAVLLGRFAALATATVIVGVATLGAAAVAAAVSGVTLDAANLVEATLGMIPLGLLIAAIGYLVSGWLRTAADTGLISFVLAAWFFISFVGPDLKWPDATLRLSAFYYYGTPLLHGLQLANIAVLVVVGAVALVLGSLRFARKDIGV